MSGAICLSVHGPCATVCARCSESYENYVRAFERTLIENSIRALESRGYTVIPPKQDEGEPH